MPLGDRVITTRRRSIPVIFPKTRFVNQNLTNGVPDGPPSVSIVMVDTKTLQGTQYTVSENHPGWRFRKSGVFAGDYGGNFLSQKRYVTFIGGLYREFLGRSTGFLTTFQGAVLPTNELLIGDRFPAYQHSSDATLDAYGSTAIARVKPARPHADLLTGLIELKREGLPKMVGHQAWVGKTIAARKRAAGGEYLNIEFGWKPLVNEIASVAVVIAESEALINQYIRDAGKQVRRRYEFPPITSEETLVFNGSTGVGLVGASGGALFKPAFPSYTRGRVILHRKVERRVWFSGAFVYHLPIDPVTMRKGMDKRKGLQKMLGADLTPDVIWNATPWSWAADWVTNTGDVISNLQSWTHDRMVLRYGYVMEHVKCTDTYTHIGDNGLRASHVRAPIVQFVSETKQRRKATPFGFGLKYGDFTNRQKAIIAALGISRGKR